MRQTNLILEVSEADVVLDTEAKLLADEIRDYWAAFNRCIATHERRGDVQALGSMKRRLTKALYESQPKVEYGE